MLLDAQLRVIDSSPTGAVLVRAFNADPQKFSTLFQNVTQKMLPVEQRMPLSKGERYWLTATPHPQGVLIIGRDTTLNDRMTEALLASRSLLKSLLDRAVDLSFEVDADNIFQFLSPMDALGRNLETWLGRSANDLFWSDGKMPARSPLSSKVAITFEAVQVALSPGQVSWLSFTVEPQFDEDQKFSGVRGTCRDVSDRVANQRETRMDNLRLGLQQRIMDLLNTAQTSEDLLDSAANELIEMLRADLVWSVVKYPEGLVPVAICGDSTETPDVDMIWRNLALNLDKVIEVQDRNRKHLAVRLEQGDSAIGMIVVSRDTTLFPWASHERQLLSDVIGSLAAAFGKAQLINRLTRLSSLDELTGLSNRRAFIELVERRLQHQCRTGQTGCLLFIDLDHFKEVNDTLGHGAGDDAIRLMGDILQTVIRASDYAGRYGGDEFVVWLEDIRPADAALKARTIIDAMPGIREKIKGAHLKLSASIGICASIPGKDLTFAAMAERADAALYEVKNAGRGSVAIAATPEFENKKLLEASV